MLVALTQLFMDLNFTRRRSCALRAVCVCVCAALPRARVQQAVMQHDICRQDHKTEGMC